MSVLIRRYKGNNGMMQEERIDDDTRIERYMKLFEKEQRQEVADRCEVLHREG